MLKTLLKIIVYLQNYCAVAQFFFIILFVVKLCTLEKFAVTPPLTVLLLTLSLRARREN
jgi:hypothetical protein